MNNSLSSAFATTRNFALLEAVIGVERPLASAGGGLSIQPVGREHHEDEVGVELLLFVLHTVQLVIVRFHTCRSESVSLEDTKKNCAEIKRIVPRAVRMSVL